MKKVQEATANNGWSSKCIFISRYSLSYCFYIHIILLISIAIIQLRFSIVYTDFCTIDNRITLYLFIMGIIQVVYSFNGILLIIFCLIYDKYRCIISLLLICFVVHQLLLLLLIICFIIGNYLVFHIKDDIQYINSYNVRTYCDYKLYQTAFWTTIIYYVLIILFSIVLVIQNEKWFIKQLEYFKNNCSRIPDQATVEIL